MSAFGGKADILAASPVERADARTESWDLHACSERDIEAECGGLRRAPPWNSKAKTDTSSCYEFGHAHRDLRWWRDRCRNRLLHKPTRRAVDRHRTSCRRRCGLRQVGWLPGPRLVRWQPA